MKIKNRKGFTFVEMMATIIIMGIIFLMTAPMITAKMKTDTINTMKTDIRALASGAQVYRQDVKTRNGAKPWNPKATALSMSLYTAPIITTSPTTEENITYATIKQNTINPLILEILYDKMKTMTKVDGTGNTVPMWSLAETGISDTNYPTTLKLYPFDASKLFGVTLANDITDYAYEPYTGTIVSRHAIRGSDGLYHIGSLNRVELKKSVGSREIETKGIVKFW